jgi:hypothetical protein
MSSLLHMYLLPQPLLSAPADVQQEEHGDDDAAGHVHIVPGRVEVVATVRDDLLQLVSSLQQQQQQQQNNVSVLSSCTKYHRHPRALRHMKGWLQPSSFYLKHPHPVHGCVKLSIMRLQAATDSSAPDRTSLS